MRGLRSWFTSFNQLIYESNKMPTAHAQDALGPSAHAFTELGTLPFTSALAIFVLNTLKNGLTCLEGSHLHT
jgi:hypothetical protein